MSRDEIGGRGDREPFVPRGGGIALALGAVVLATAVGALRLADQFTAGAGRPDPVRKPDRRSPDRLPGAGPLRRPGGLHRPATRRSRAQQPAPR